MSPKAISDLEYVRAKVDAVPLQNVTDKQIRSYLEHLGDREHAYRALYENWHGRPYRPDENVQLKLGLS